jgi:hypothetical protein
MLNTRLPRELPLCQAWQWLRRHWKTSGVKHARASLLILVLVGGCVSLLSELGISATLGVSWVAAVWQPTTTPTPSPSPSPLTAAPADLPPNVRAFIQLALPYAQQAHATLTWQTSVILAQWGLEHGWQVPDSQGYNWGNTTYAPGCPKPGRFCYASTPEEGLREYVYTAQLHYYDGVRAAVPQGADATAVALGQSPWDEGHYTGDGSPGDSLLRLMREFNLYRFD